MHNFDEDGCFDSGRDVRVTRRLHGRGPVDTRKETFEVVAAHRIVISTDDKALANGLAATFAALTPTQANFDMKLTLDTLRDLVSARRFLAELVGREASALGNMASVVRSASERLYGSND